MAGEHLEATGPTPPDEPVPVVAYNVIPETLSVPFLSARSFMM